MCVCTLEFPNKDSGTEKKLKKTTGYLTGHTKVATRVTEAEKPTQPKKHFPYKVQYCKMTHRTSLTSNAVHNKYFKVILGM